MQPAALRTLRFIAVAPDSDAACGTEPKETAKPTIAAATYRMIRDNPYRYTSDDVIFTVWAERKGIPPEERAAAREAFFSKGRACLCASDLGKKYGWGIHSDSEGRVALYGVETEDYRRLARGQGPGGEGQRVKLKKAMRSGR